MKKIHREDEVGGRQLVGLRVDDDDRGEEEQQPDHRRAAVEPAEQPRRRGRAGRSRRSASVTSLPRRRERDPDRRSSDGRDRCREGEPLHEEERERHQRRRSNGKNQPGPAADPVRGGARQSPSTTPARARTHGECSRPTSARTKSADPLHGATVASASPPRRHPAGRLSRLDRRCVTIYRDSRHKERNHMTAITVPHDPQRRPSRRHRRTPGSRSGS